MHVILGLMANNISQPDCEVAGGQKDDRGHQIAEVQRINYESQDGEER